MSFLKRYKVLISISLIIFICIIIVLCFNNSSEYSNYDKVYDVPGIYSLADEYEDIIIISEGVEIENVTAQTITLSSEVLKGEVHITNVLVEGTLTILGAGTVYISNSLINEIIVDYSVTTLIIDESSEIDVIEAKDISQLSLDGYVNLLKLYDARLNVELGSKAYISQFYISSSVNSVNVYGTGSINLIGVYEKDILTYVDSVVINNLFYVDEDFENIVYSGIFYSELDEVYQESLVYKYDQLSVPVDPYKEGYSFEGWFLEGEIFDFSTQLDSDIELYARWSYVDIVDSSTIFYIEDVNYEDEQDSLVEVKPSIEEDNIFGSGSDSSEDETIIYEIIFNYDNEEDIIYNVESGTIIKEVDKPYKEGYTFINWLDEFGNVYDFNSIIDSNLELRAYYEINTYSVIFESYLEEENIVLNLDYNSVITETYTPFKEGYKFIGWYLDPAYEEEYSFDSLVTEDLTLYAKYEEIKFYTVKFYYCSEDGEFINYKEFSVEEGSTINDLDLNIEDYELEGWYLDTAYEFEVDFKNMIITNDTVLYAKLALSDLEVDY